MYLLTHDVPEQGGIIRACTIECESLEEAIKMAKYSAKYHGFPYGVNIQEITFGKTIKVDFDET